MPFTQVNWQPSLSSDYETYVNNWQDEYESQMDPLHSSAEDMSVMTPENHHDHHHQEGYLPDLRFSNMPFSSRFDSSGSTRGSSYVPKSPVQDKSLPPLPMSMMAAPWMSASAQDSPRASGVTSLMSSRGGYEHSSIADDISRPSTASSQQYAPSSIASGRRPSGGSKMDSLYGDVPQSQQFPSEMYTERGGMRSPLRQASAPALRKPSFAPSEDVPALPTFTEVQEKNNNVNQIAPRKPSLTNVRDRVPVSSSPRFLPAAIAARNPYTVEAIHQSGLTPPVRCSAWSASTMDARDSVSSRDRFTVHTPSSYTSARTCQSTFTSASATARSSAITGDTSYSEFYSPVEATHKEEEIIDRSSLDRDIDDTLELYAEGFEDDEPAQVHDYGFPAQAHAPEQRQSFVEYEEEEEEEKENVPPTPLRVSGTGHARSCSNASVTSHYGHRRSVSIQSQPGQYRMSYVEEDYEYPSGAPEEESIPEHVEEESHYDMTYAEEDYEQYPAAEEQEPYEAPVGEPTLPTFTRPVTILSYEDIAPAPESPIRNISAPIIQGSGPQRDRYGFKTANQYISQDQYDVWNRDYTLYLERRKDKWLDLMQRNGLDTDSPWQFPVKSDKVKRYIRKGIPPAWRGAAWFWYAGGPMRLASNPGLYDRLLLLVDAGHLGEANYEQIERDLHRTFPDNVEFRPDDAEGDVETPIVASLRRVLQAFAVHNPTIGYCQSLNFIAGMLLLFMNRDEEKVFHMLDIITTTHLPGTHGVGLEGANVDIGVLMSCIKDTLPSVWAKISDQPAPRTGILDSKGRLPTVSLATTAWFMSLFIGTLPIETVLRVWDVFFYEGSKTLFRIALAVCKAGETEIRRTTEQMEIFQVVQTIPRRLIDCNALMEATYKKRGGFVGLSQETVEKRRAAQRDTMRCVREGSFPLQQQQKSNRMARMASMANLKRPKTAGGK